MTCPSGKIPYRTPQAAHTALCHQAKRKRHGRHAPKWAPCTLTTYRCRMCGQFHVGHATVRAKRPVAVESYA